MILERQVAVRHVVGSSAERRHNARVTAQVVVWRSVIVAILSVPLVAFVAGRIPDGCPGSYSDSSKALVQVYAFEAFPQWATANQWTACPQTIDELSPFVHDQPAVDAWGTKLEMRCVPGTRLYVRSAGDDRIFDTADDITSND